MKERSIETLVAAVEDKGMSDLLGKGVKRGRRQWKTKREKRRKGR